jgi:protein involved in polysaccharide export with SLBB domain
LPSASNSADRDSFARDSLTDPGLGKRQDQTLLLRKTEPADQNRSDQNNRTQIQPPEEREKTTAESFFSRPFPAIGDALGESREVKGVVDKEENLLLLLSSGDRLTTEEKAGIFFRLEDEQRRRYQQQLPMIERQILLRSLGEEASWYVEDLRSADISRDLQQFGFDFFSRERAGFTPDELSLVGPDYVLGPGDTLDINIWGSIDGQYRTTVGRNGEIVLPKVGPISVWGQTFSEAQKTIHQQIARNFTNFQLNVTMGALRSIQVFVIGEVQSPGRYTVSSLATVLTALSTAGGPSGNGSLRTIEVQRAGAIVATVDLYDFFLRGDKSKDLRLQSGDTLFVPVARTFVGVAGDVRRPAIYELHGSESLPEVLAMAGGTNPTAFMQKVQVEQIDASSRKRIILDVDLSDPAAATTLQLHDRDLVKVVPASTLTASYVRLLGHVSRPGSYQFIPEMRLADLVAPHDNLLPGYFPGLVEILRLQPPSYRPERLTVDLTKALQGDSAHNVLLQEYDEIKIFAAREMEEIPEVAVSGAVLNPGSYRLYDQMSVRDLVVAAGNARRKAYLPEAEITRFIPAGKETRTERLFIDLGKALDSDPAHNLVLAPDDHLFVRSIPDFAEQMMVELKGEVVFPGNYAISKGETLSSVLQRAGGFTDKAYLRGALFTRASLKESQRQRIDQLIFEQEQEILRISTQMAQGAISGEEMAAAQAIVASRSAMLDKLKAAPVQGRMVVRLKPLQQFTGSEYDIELMNGDGVTVPHNPQSVAVFGQVYNPIALTYKSGKTVGYYLNEVGGPKKEANKDEIYVVRADGTVISTAQGGWGLRWDSDATRWTAGGFSSTILYPGDTVLVPEKVEKTAWLREMRDISQIIFQLALGAAAVASF